MPIYTFLCHACAYEFDEIVPYDPNNTPIDCPHECGRTAYRLPSIPAQSTGAFGTTRKRSTVTPISLKFPEKKNDGS